MEKEPNVYIRDTQNATTHFLPKHVALFLSFWPTALIMNLIASIPVIKAGQTIGLLSKRVNPKVTYH